MPRLPVLILIHLNVGSGPGIFVLPKDSLAYGNTLTPALGPQHRPRLYSEKKKKTKRLGRKSCGGPGLPRSQPPGPHAPGSRVLGPGSDQNRLGNHRPGPSPEPRLSDQFITSERRAPSDRPGGLGDRGAAAARGPRCTAPGTDAGLRRREAFHLRPARRGGGLGPIK